MSAGADDDPDDIALAGEYVLRLLSPEQQAAFEQRMRAEPELRRLVAAWEADFAVLAEDVAPVTPPSRVKRRLTAALFAPPRRSFWRLLGGAVAGLTVAAVIALSLSFFDYAPTGEPIYRAEISAPDSSLIVTAQMDDAGRLSISRVAGAPTEGRSHELWLIAEGAEAPVSLGLIDDPMTEFSVPSEMRALIAGSTLAISDEPRGGSPTGLPTGDVLAIGQISEV